MPRPLRTPSQAQPSHYLHHHTLALLAPHVQPFADTPTLHTPTVHTPTAPTAPHSRSSHSSHSSHSSTLPQSIPLYSAFFKLVLYKVKSHTPPMSPLYSPQNRLFAHIPPTVDVAQAPYSAPVPLVRIPQAPYSAPVPLVRIPVPLVRIPYPYPYPYPYLCCPCAASAHPVSAPLRDIPSSPQLVFPKHLQGVPA